MTADELNNPCDSAADSRHYNETALIERRYSNWQAHATAG
jgi:hypothetical protein